GTLLMADPTDVYHWSGTEFVAAGCTVGNDSIVDLAIAGGNGWAVTGGGAGFHVDESLQCEVEAPLSPTPVAIAARAPTQAWVVGAQGAVWSRDVDGGWQASTHGTDDFGDVAASATAVFAVTKAGLLVDLADGSTPFTASSRCVYSLAVTDLA